MNGGSILSKLLQGGSDDFVQAASKFGGKEDMMKWLGSNKGTGSADSVISLIKESLGDNLSNVGMQNDAFRQVYNLAKLKPNQYADEASFLSAQGQPLYHGTDATFDKFDLDHFGKTDEGFLGKGVYMSSNRDTASQYGKNVMEVYPELRSPYTYDDSYSFGAFSPHTMRSKLGLDTHASAQDVTKQLRSMGHDSVSINEIGGNPMEEVVAFNPYNIRTRQQLQDIYRSMQ